MTSEKATKKRRPQPAVIYTEVVLQKTTPKPDSEAAGSVADVLSSSPDPDADGKTAEEPETKSHSEQDADMSAQVSYSFWFLFNFAAGMILTFLTFFLIFTTFSFFNKNSSGDEIANVNFYAVRSEATRIR